ncbi:MAG: UbiD family decarboxylase domain-containing protein, partial [Nitrososphaeraceae archaeon]
MNTKTLIGKKQKDSKNIAQDFRSFLFFLEEEEELVRTNKSVSTKFELAAVVSKLEGKQAILFEKINESRFKVVSNLIGTRRRFSLALGTKEQNLIHSHILESNANMIEHNRISGRAPFYENCSKNLSKLPIITNFEKDAVPYITSSVVFAKDPEKRTQNSSTHR